MGPAYYVLAIMGCGDGATMCEQVAREATLYRSETACLAETEEVLIRESDRPYPLLMAECQRIAPQIASFWENSEG
ncbi:hypothetical protein HFP57_12215 [Parasphingopyxis algicola]|uniref:hypothetical protein n=1 Tax=Parasphingopyxis algicola TaxID=2026624 RepID=UPI0015A2AD6E|nr:hypothetical protein [Parasphingopyxis algicola]QLC25706.1 hypothetical protein HFP57_12215 [Parasphingopyxis algicola]